jgi:EmrB/QacA subfamily drug resistance transporter
MSHAVRLPCDEGAIRCQERVPTAQAGVGAWVLAATIIGSSLAFIDGTVVSVALPAIAREFKATGSEVQWVVEGYALFLSALLLVGGSLGDRFGRRRIYALGLVLFTAASIACGSAHSIAQLILARCVQGVGGALLVPGALALIASSFEPDERGRAIGTWSGFSGITAAIGPLVGGWLVNHSWRWAFLINAPLAVIVLLLLSKVPESRSPRAQGLDAIGAVLVTIGLGGLVYGLIESSQRGWGEASVVTALAAGCGGLAAFVFREARASSPMLPLHLFRSADFTGTNALTLFLYGALACAFFFLPLDLIQVQRYSPLQAGAALLPFIAILFLLSRWSGGLVARYGPRRPLIIGPAIASLGFVLLSLPGLGGSYWRTFFPGILVLGLGMAVSIAPLTTAVMNAVGSESAGIASGVNNAVSRAAGLLSIALLGILITSVFDRELERRVAALPLDPGVRHHVLSERGKLAAAEPPGGLSGEQAHAVRVAIGASFVEAFRAACRACCVLALLAAACAWVWIGRGEALKRARGETNRLPTIAPSSVS